MKTKILAGVALLSIATAGTLTYAASTNTGSTALKNTFTKMHMTGSGGFMGEHRGRGGEGRDMGGFEMGKMNGPEMMGKGPMSSLTDAEKTKLETMTNVEKKAFFEAKMTAEKVLRDSKEAVIDKLINGEALSDTEKVTLEAIKVERTAQKTERLAREAKMTEMKPIMEKVRAGTALTADEQTKLDAFKATMPNGGREGKKGGMRGMGR